ncbi:MAG: hypothetical protein EHM12_10260, partial [Dehalococcoidia bacterium]
MVGLSMLWLPILLSAIAAFVASCVIHMTLPWHKNDYRNVPKEDELMDALRPFAIPPGDYSVPRASSMKEMGSPEFVAKMKKGPVFMLTMLPSGPASMVKSLVLWFVYMVVVGIFAAYVAGRALPAGAEFRQVFRFTGTVAFIGYSLALWQMTIWYNRSWAATLRSTVDGLVYALACGAVFGWLWP